MKVAIVHEDFSARPDAPIAESDVLNTVTAVWAALVRVGHAPVCVPIMHDVIDWTRRLAAEHADVVFNLCEGLGGDASHEVRVASVLELMGVPVTGAPSELLALARRKDRVHALLSAAGLPTPRSALAQEHADAAAWLDFPAIVKPAGEDGSVGIQQHSVVRTLAELVAALERAAGTGPQLIQEFLPGAELAVGFVGARVLPVSQIDYSGVRAGAWPLVTYDAKWLSDSADYQDTPVCCPAQIDEAMHEAAVRLAVAAWRLLGGRGYGRVDLRADERGRLHVLDVNPNPDLGPDAGLARMAAVAGWTYDQLVSRILHDACAA